ncbi:hypothetical protein R3W88_033709 [Solanum pinnatisectum]|uniref:GRF-type domain-containing protein n=1 Tax=Solanum pinnatisectum TaxID=50273 RepID=A0AAV9K2B7_9SOLN|nr:hypothetical protein R3W88_033709 [Solanum pinnatisectum]
MLILEVRCSHGLLLPLKISWSDNNPGRRFWSCPYYGARKCNFFRWRDGLIDEKSKLIIPKLVKKIKKMDKQLMSKVKIMKKMKEMAHYNDSEIVEMMKNSIVMDLEGESALSVKKKKDKEEDFDFHDCEEFIKNAAEKSMEVKKKGTSYSNFIRIFIILVMINCHSSCCIFLVEVFCDEKIDFLE